ncbi:MAG: energy-coupling factor transport system permease protein [Solirubrobacteraceae bacterium]|nr:energy-coupling factor transport system permease protein [Solirubrobacteraceae bacterium]
MIYRRRPSPLHAARAVVGLAWCVAISVAALVVHHPAVLFALVVAVVGAGFGARVGRTVLIGLAVSVPFGLAIVVCNGVFSRNGITVVWRLGGSWDVTSEALVQGGIYALSAAAILCVAGLYSAAVDPDDLLRSCRRLSFTSALTAALATRLVPVLWRDGQRLADAQRARAGEPASRLMLMRAVSTGAMDRALDVAATLEVRGYGAPRAAAGPRAAGPRAAGPRAATLGRALAAAPRRAWRARRAPSSGAGRPAWSRHDITFLASAVAVIVLALVSRDAASFHAYPRVVADWSAGAWLVTAGLVAAVLAPFADRRGIG